MNLCNISLVFHFGYLVVKGLTVSLWESKVKQIDRIVFSEIGWNCLSSIKRLGHLQLHQNEKQYVPFFPLQVFTKYVPLLRWEYL